MCQECTANPQVGQDEIERGGLVQWMRANLDLDLVQYGFESSGVCFTFYVNMRFKKVKHRLSNASS